MEKDNIEIKEEIKVSKRFKKVQKSKSFGKIVQVADDEEFEISESSLINEKNVNTKQENTDFSFLNEENIQSNNIEKEEKYSNFFEINNDSGYNINKSIDGEKNLSYENSHKDVSKEKIDEAQSQKLNEENAINDRFVDSKYSLLKELEFDSFLKTEDSPLIKNNDYEYNDVSFIKSLEEKYKIDLNDSNKERGYSYNIEKDNKREIKNEILNNSGDTLKSQNNDKTDVKNIDKINDDSIVKDAFLNKDKTKSNLTESKNSFDIGNILYRDYNEKTKSSISPVDALEEKKEYSNENNHSNEYRDFYDININEMPNRESLLKELYAEEDEYNRSKGATAKKGVEKNRVKGSNILGKIFKRRV